MKIHKAAEQLQNKLIGGCPYCRQRIKEIQEHVGRQHKDA